jgi:hypothetical protein
MFIRPDEHIIIMEDLYNPFSLDDLHKIEDAGIKTVYVTHPFCWNLIANRVVRDSSFWDWGSVDKRLEILLKTGLKLMLPFYHTTPDWFPDEWYIQKHPTELDHNIPNYANEDFIGAVDEFLVGALNHYRDIRDRVQLTYAIPAGGEFLWDAVLTENFPATDEQIINFVVGRQKILAKQHNEIWMLFHNFLGDPMNWNNTHLPVLYQALANEFVGTDIYSIQGAHFSCGYTTSNENQMKVKEYNKKFGIKFFVGSDYCEGLSTNFDAALEQGVRGFLTAPLHHSHPKQFKVVKPWMVDAIKEANQKFMEISNGSN